MGRDSRKARQERKGAGFAGKGDFIKFFFLLEHSSILLPQASSEALFN